MDAILERCAGLDVHQASVVACVLTGELDQKPKQTVQTFGTTTDDLIQLRDWLQSHQVTHVAMESTGVYWIPVWNILEGAFQLVLGNARLIKNVPGRKTDIKDAVWIAQLLRCGLIAGSFIPPEVIRQVRSYTRYRYKLNGQVTAEKNRVQKMLETANIKLASFVEDVFGVSGMALLQALVDGEVLDAQRINHLVHTKMKAKVPQLIKALNGRINMHHRDMISMHLAHLAFLQQQIAELDGRIAQLLTPFEEQIQLLDSVPGINETAAAYILAEIGTDVGATFPSDAHLSSWAGVCPGLNESAGRKKSSKIPKGKRILKAILCQCAWAASFTKDTRIKAFFDRVVKRRGKKKASMAVAHLLIRLIYSILTTKKPYHELGYAYLFDQSSQEHIWIRKLRDLGYEVSKPQQI